MSVCRVLIAAKRCAIKKERDNVFSVASRYFGASFDLCNRGEGRRNENAEALAKYVRLRMEANISELAGLL